MGDSPLPTPSTAAAPGPSGRIPPDPQLLPSALCGLPILLVLSALLVSLLTPAQMTLLGVSATLGGARVSVASFLGTRPPAVVRKKGSVEKTCWLPGAEPSALPEGWLPPQQGRVALCTHPASVILCPGCFL